jgi:hypothetical protein
MVACNVLFSGWNRPVVGRERQAMELFQRAVGLYTKWQASGLITSFEPCILTGHGGDMNGFFLIRGEPEKLAALRRNEEFTAMQIEAGLVIEKHGTVDGYVGDAVMGAMQLWGGLVAKL